ncbi:hypothetical protein [Clostridium tetani]|uniref:hypothetical protein n=1 Tax=Clostridium tetani TaxID=1513 RepID=UPI00100B5A3D|nr:hypothetical protein [Clostridium tetani]RXM56723.1 hypothetical protein DP133_13455 [Clostridium tetani]RXM74249.1 hypothetical protein DP154_12960 [Clostridium tetani]RYU98017.1 hypothetical protein DP144_12735 [Clostridium tetani]
MDSAIYCPYNKAVKIGFNFSVTKSVSVQEAAEIRNHFRNINEGINYSTGVLGIALGMVLPTELGATAALGTVIAGQLQNKFTKQEKLLDDLIIASKGPFKIRLNYEYKYRNSFDGAYLLDSVDII